MTQRFTWSETKRQRILAERGFDLLRAARIFRGPVRATDVVSDGGNYTIDCLQAGYTGPNPK